jgi:hypothetical protein
MGFEAADMSKALVGKLLTATLPEVARTAAELGKAAKSNNTRRAYDADWRSFRAWCAESHLTALPATSATVGLYIAAIGVGAGARSPSTIERALAGIAHKHRMQGLPFDRRHPAIADVLAGLKRTRRRPVQQKAALTPDLMRKLLEACGIGQSCSLVTTAHCGARSSLASTSST